MLSISALSTQKNEVIKILTEILVAVISGGLALIGSFIATYFQSSKTTALILYRLDKIEEKQDKHNNVIERTYELEKDYSVLEKRESVSEHRINDLEKYHN